MAGSILTEISLLSNALQDKNLDIIKADKLVINSIKAFQMLDNEIGSYEKKVDELISSETCKNINIIKNHSFVGLPRQKLLETIILNLKKRLMDCDHIKASCNEIQGIGEINYNKLQFLNILEPDNWNIEEVIPPWKAAEEQLPAFNEIFKYKINTNDFRDFVENVLKNSQNYKIPKTV